MVALVTLRFGAMLAGDSKLANVNHGLDVAASLRVDVHETPRRRLYAGTDDDLSTAPAECVRYTPSEAFQLHVEVLAYLRPGATHAAVLDAMADGARAQA